MQIPLLIEDLKHSEIFQDKLTRFTETYRREVPEFEIPQPSDPIYQILSELAYSELIIRQKINHAALAQLVALSSELDFIFQGQRREGEAFADFLSRVLLAIGASSPAGSREMYRALAILSGRFKVGDAVHGVLDAAIRPEGGKVVVYVLPDSKEIAIGNGLARAVAEYLTRESVKPALDDVEVRVANSVTVNIQADFRLKPGYGQSALDAIQKSLLLSWQRELRLGWMPSVSWITKELHTAAVDAVKLKTPISDAPDSPTRAIEYPSPGKITLALERLT
jgi:phage-related baseplate assembly protein